MWNKDTYGKAINLLNVSVQQSTSPDIFDRNRIVSYGAAAVMLAVLLQILQVSNVTIALKVTIIACSIAMPLFLVIGLLQEYYLILGPRSYAHFSRVFFGRFMAGYQFIAYGSFIVAIGSVIYHLFPIALIVFGVACVIVAFIWWGIHFTLARELYEADLEPKPGSRAPTT